MRKSAGSGTAGLHVRRVGAPCSRVQLKLFIGRIWKSESLGDLLDPQIPEFLDLAGQHGFVAANHDRPLDKFWMPSHDGKQFLVVQILPSHVFSVRIFFSAQNFLRLQPGLLQ